MPATPTVKQHANGRWYIHWTDGRRSKRVSTGATSLRAARAALAEWLKLDRGEAHAAVVQTCADAWECYGRKDLPSRKAAWRRLGPAFGTRRVHDVMDADIEEYSRKQRAAGYSVGTIWQDVNLLIASWHAAVKARKLPASAVPRITRPEKPRPRERWLTEQEIEAVLTAASSDLDEDGRLSRGARFVWLALQTGARLQAILHLRWEHVIWNGSAALIDYQAGMISRRQKRRAVVPASARLLPILRRMQAERRTEYVLDRPTDITLQLRRVLRAAGVQGVSAHTFRHTAATYMTRAGVPIALGSKVLGNTAAVYEGVYAKHAPQWLQAAVDAIPGVRADGAQRAKLGTENGLHRPDTAPTGPISEDGFAW